MFQKLTPDAVKANLMRASLFLTGFELLKLELMDKLQTFYATDFDEAARGKESEDYRKEVLSLAPQGVHPNTREFYASCEWWVKEGTLTADDIEKIKAIKKHRNLIAHELPKILIDPAFSVNSQLFVQLRHLIGILGRFWGRIAIESNEEFDGQEISNEAIESGPMVLIGYIEQLMGDHCSAPVTASDQAHD
jgi:hypothetical protein